MYAAPSRYGNKPRNVKPVVLLAFADAGVHGKGRSGQQSGIHGQHHTRHPAGFIAGEKEGGVGDVPGVTLHSKGAGLSPPFAGYTGSMVPPTMGV